MMGSQILHGSGLISRVIDVKQDQEKSLISAYFHQLHPFPYVRNVLKHGQSYR